MVTYVAEIKFYKNKYSSFIHSFSENLLNPRKLIPTKVKLCILTEEDEDKPKKKKRKEKKFIRKLDLNTQGN